MQKFERPLPYDFDPHRENITYHLHKDIDPKQLFSWLKEQFQSGIDVTIDWQPGADYSDHAGAFVDAIISAGHIYNRLHAGDDVATLMPLHITGSGDKAMLQAYLHFRSYALNEQDQIAPIDTAFSESQDGTQ